MDSDGAEDGQKPSGSSKRGSRSTRKSLQKRKLSPQSSSSAVAASPIAKKPAPGNKSLRKCDKGGCEDTAPLCLAKACDRCAGMGYTSRWYHMSSAEHFCNECFEHYYRSNKPGNADYLTWRRKWQSTGSSEPNLKLFFADCVMPFWVQCTLPLCRKWRVLPRHVEPSSTVVASFMCGSKGKKDSKSCAVPEDEEAKRATDPRWIETLVLPPMLRDSPSADLLGGYYADGVGLSPACDRTIKAVDIYQDIMNAHGAQQDTTDDDEKTGSKGSMKQDSKDDERPQVSKSIISPTIPGLNRHFAPFYQPSEHGKAFCTRPDMMDRTEEHDFREYAKQPVMYLGVRNLIITLWNYNCKKWLTIEDVAPNLLCRGLARIRCLYEAERVLKYLTRKGTINFGIVSPPAGFRMVEKDCTANVVVIGAGPAGISAARQLKNFGIKVTVIEARDRIGGRIWDDDSLGVCIGKGAQIITGVINNPLSFMCEQAGLRMRYLGEQCDLYWMNGEPVDSVVDQKMEFHFNSTLDAVASWRNGSSSDRSLNDVMLEMHKRLLDQTDEHFTEEDMKLFHFHLSNLEYACGVNLNAVSALSWDQNEAYEQFAGEHTMLRCGYSTLMSKLAEGINVKLGKQVEKIDYSGSGTDIVLTIKDGKPMLATHVVVTVPLAILQANDIKFQPPLPDAKKKALKDLGAGVIEKVVLRFSQCFWRAKLNGADFFGFVPRREEDRGQFPLFCDMSQYRSTPESSVYVLMTHLCGDGVKIIATKTDKEVVKMCLEVLRGIFKDEDVPDPMSYVVTRWSQDPFSRMVYSYVKLGSSGEAYDVLAEDIDDKIFFAGEATNRHFPQTVAGAYVSGLREAAKILHSVT